MLPVAAIAFLGFLTIGIPLPVLPTQVHQVLGFGTVVVGWVIGLQSVATVLTRGYAGRRCDARGPKAAVLMGLPLASLAGFTYLISALVPMGAEAQLAVLLVGRLFLGFAESLFLTGTMIWGIARLGALHTGMVMSWQGIAIYAALGSGAMVGVAVQAAYGFAPVAGLAIALPLLAMLIALVLPAVPPVHGERLPFTRVIGRVWQPGLAMALSSMAWGALAAFVTLYYASRGWSGPGLPVALYSGGYIFVRLFFGGLPDKLGGRRVAAGSLVLAMSGQLILWQASVPWLAELGALITGFGISLVFPSLGVEAMKRVTPENRGLAVGAYVVFFDVALAVAGPLTGLVAGIWGYAAVFLAGAVSLALASALALLLPAATPRTP